MFSSIWDDLKQQFSQGNMITRIILVNVAVFVVINLVLVFSGGFHDPAVYNKIIRPLSFDSDWFYNITHLWGIFTHMFLHVDFWHIIWNMLLFYWFGRIVGDLIGDRRILPLYLLGGLFGAFVYFVFANLTTPNHAIGASAAVTAIIMVAGVIAPDYIMRLILIGDVRLKYIVAVILLINVIGAGGINNTGGYVAHLGGAFFGYLFATQLRNGNDWSIPVNNLLDKFTALFRNVTTQKKRGPRVAYKNPNAGNATKPNSKREVSSSYQEQLDTILDKIKEKGYESLTEVEKEFLFNASKK
jgi:membrane associated rhomboid family serine protease